MLYKRFLEQVVDEQWHKQV
ncbi:hypothetical protein CP8484711_0489A, partial [Chlamydia psittaci 84-8471/1]